MASVKLTNVKKVYDKKVVAVHDFNLDIKDKEFVVFVVPIDNVTNPLFVN